MNLRAFSTVSYVCEKPLLLPLALWKKGVCSSREAVTIKGIARRIFRTPLRSTSCQTVYVEKVASLAPFHNRSLLRCILVS